MYISQISDNATIRTSSSGKKDAGNIEFKSTSFTMDSASSVVSESLAEEADGAAGSIILNSDSTIVIRNNSAITTETTNTNLTGNGKIIISTNQTLSLENGKIATSIKGGDGYGGDIQISAKDIAMKNSIIKANAYEGDGGGIFIDSDTFVQCSDSLLEASSERGNHGSIEIVIDSPEPLQAMNKPPVVIEIPAQTIFDYSIFQPIMLDNYVTDEDHTDNEISWMPIGQRNLSVSIEDRVATISLLDNHWKGSEVIMFTAINPSGFLGLKTVIFTVQDSGFVYDLNKNGKIDLEDMVMMLQLFSANHVDTGLKSVKQIGLDDLLFIMNAYLYLIIPF